MKRFLCFVFLCGFLLTVFIMRSFAATDIATDVKYEIECVDGTYRFSKNGVLSAQSEQLDTLLDGLYGLNMPIYFNGVASDEVLSLNGQIIASGSLCVGGINIGTGGVLTLDCLNLSLDDGIFILGGNCIVKDAEISSKSTAVTLSHSASSTLDVYSGSISSQSNKSTLCIEYGSARLHGGEIVNDFGVAIENAGDLYLGNITVCGVGYDLVSSRPFWGSTELGAFCRRLHVKLLSTFEKGTSTRLIINTGTGIEENIQLYDKNGMRVDLTEIGNDLYVHMPFTANFVFENKSVRQIEFLKGETIIPPEITIPDGYDFVGWSTEIDGGTSFDFASLCNRDITLYGIKRLTPPSYSINGINTVYNGESVALAFSKIEHALDGKITYTWYSESGEIISTSSSVSFKSTTESGRYKCKLLFAFGADSVSVETPYIEVKINPRIIKIPKVNTAVYNGNGQYPTLVENGFSYNAVPYRDAGVYKVPLTLDDPINTRWEGTESRIAYATFEILRANNDFVDISFANNVYLGAEFNFSAKTVFGNAVIMYSKSPDGEYDLNPPSELGTYYAIAVVEGTNNYYRLESAPHKFNVIEDAVKRFTVKTLPIKGVYRAFEIFNPDGIVFEVLYESGKSEDIGFEKVNFSYPSGECFSVLHNSVYAEYCGVSVALPVTVKPAKYEFDLTVSSITVCYNSLYQTLIPSGSIAPGLDGICPTYTVVGGGCDVGIYTVTVEFKTESIEYATPQPITAYIEILPLPVDVRWSDLLFVYDGRAKVPRAFFTDIFGVNVELKVNGAASVAGDNYSAFAVCENANYLLCNDTTEFTIERAEYDLSAITWTQSGFSYTGDIISVCIGNLPIGVTVVGYTNNTAKNAGEYCATAILKGDEINYHPIEAQKFNYTIKKAEYPTDCFSITGGEYIYDGVLHYPILNGSLPVGADGISLEYSFSHGVKNVYDEPEIIVSFNTQSENYTAPKDLLVRLTVIPCDVYVVWDDVSLVYNGRAQLPTAFCSECAVSVLGEAVNAGSYTAVATTDNPNYRIVNQTREFFIEKAPNFWIKAPQIKDIFFGHDLNYVCEAAFGDVICEIFNDEELSQRVELPPSPGEYYAVFYSDAGQNYKPLTSTPMPFSVIPILPASISVDGKYSYVAFESVKDGDLTVTLINNDGSSRVLDFSEILLEYNNGDSFRASDNFLEVSYQNIRVSYPVTVERAVYDLSGIRWTNLEWIFDGSPHTPSLTGLPSGISVLRYEGANEINAGEYSVTAVLGFDSENYVEPQSPTATMIIKKRAVTPYSLSATYNGTPQSAIPMEDLYCFEDKRFTDAGEYYLGVHLLDKENYYLTESVAKFTILPQSVAVKVNDADAYWFEAPTDFSLSLEKGYTVSIDELAIEYYVSDGEIFAKSSNPNYRLVVKTGRVINRNRLSPRLIRAMYISLLLYVILIFGAAILVIRRDDLYRMCQRLFRKRVVTAAAGTAAYPSSDFVSVDVKKADELISDAVAKTLIKRDDFILTSGKKRFVINVDTLNEHFSAGDVIDINVLKERRLAPLDAGYLKVLGRGIINKSLTVRANAFSLNAVKMIALTGGCAIIVKKKQITLEKPD